MVYVKKISWNFWAQAVSGPLPGRVGGSSEKSWHKRISSLLMSTFFDGFSNLLCQFVSFLKLKNGSLTGIAPKSSPPAAKIVILLNHHIGSSTVFWKVFRFFSKMNQAQSPLNPTSQKSLYAVLFLNTELEHFEILAKCDKSWCGHVHTLSTLLRIPFSIAV